MSYGRSTFIFIFISGKGMKAFAKVEQDIDNYSFQLGTVYFLYPENNIL